jgi:hypothetical protein
LRRSREGSGEDGGGKSSAAKQARKRAAARGHGRQTAYRVDRPLLVTWVSMEEFTCLSDGGA